jgi:hypothetical protein
VHSGQILQKPFDFRELAAKLSFAREAASVREREQSCSLPWTDC